TAVLLLARPALDAARGLHPVGGRRDADGGAALVAAQLTDAPYGTVLYDHWYSWQWRYHLYDRGVYVAWVPHPAALARDLRAFGGSGQPRYLALPDTAAARPFRRAVADAGFALTPVFSPPSGTIALYRITEGPP
ncbi:MAG: hypothetical protein KC425_15970, partial [Anaerolineales bacterium]|nr:hypothetical protein [Anaerolineales bacterium]